MRANRRDEGTGDPAVSEVPVASKFKSVRRVFRIMDLVSQRGEELTAKELARELGTNLSSCYYLLNILADEGYIRKIAGGGYRIGPTIPLLNEGFEERLRHEDRAGRQGACAARPEARLRGGALGRGGGGDPGQSPGETVLLRGGGGRVPRGLARARAGQGAAGRRRGRIRTGIHRRQWAGGVYAADHRPPQPTARAHLNKVLMVGVATDFEEFAQNLAVSPRRSRAGAGRWKGP